MKPGKNSVPPDPVNQSRRRLLKTAAWATSLSVTGGVMQLLQGCAPESVESEPVQDVLELGARAAVGHIQQGDMTAESYASLLLEQYNAHKDLNAVVTIDEARVLEAARAVDQARTRGDELGLLSGLPFVVKDQIDVAGYPTTAGNAALKGYVPVRSAPVVDAMVKNGGIVFAKTNLPDMVVGGNLLAAASSANPFFGTVRNPYDPGRIPGGSSGGTAAAIAARMVPAGLGEDTGGSVRFPSAFCGLAGLRPSTFTAMNVESRDRVPKRYSGDGIIPPPGLLETIGPMARTVADVAFLDTIITGEPVPPTELSQVRLGIPRADYWDSELIDQGLAATMQAAFSKLRDAGLELVEIDFQSILQLDEGGRLSDAARLPRSDLGEWLAENLPGVTIEDVYAGRDMPTRREAQLSTEERVEILTTAASFYEDVFETNGLAAIAFPTIPIPAPPIDPDTAMAVEETLVNGKMVDVIAPIVMNIFFGPRLGAPGLAIPAGLTSGLPVGLELEGLPGDDSRLLGLGIAVENVLGPIPPPPLAQGTG